MHLKFLLNVKKKNQLQSDGTGRLEIYYFHPDHLGTSTYLSDANGNSYQFFLNLPFGESMAEQRTGSFNNPYKFNGKELDSETGFYYYGARYYDPQISTWLSVDPLVEQTMDAYGYVYYNPLRYIDPTGMYAMEGNCPDCGTAANEDNPIVLSDTVAEGFKRKTYDNPRVQYSYDVTYNRMFSELQSRVNDEFTSSHARIWADYYGQSSAYHEQLEMQAYKQRQAKYWDEKGKYLAYGSVGAVITPALIITGIVVAPTVVSAYGTTSATMTNWGIKITVQGARYSTTFANSGKELLIDYATKLYIQHGSKALKHFLYGKGAHDYFRKMYGNQITVSPEQFTTAMDGVFHFITSQSLGVPKQGIKPTPK